ncbi:MAG: hypothetical protein R6U61_09150 [Thermoplasmata archaeon]
MSFAVALIEVLKSAASNPVYYSILFFTYAVLAAVILPIPVEVGLFNFLIHPAILITVLALGKGVGSLIVFEISTKVRNRVKKMSVKNRFIKKIVDFSEWFVQKYGSIGLFLILSTPLMIDSITLYLFSLLNPEEDHGRALSREWFVFINIMGGAVRGLITLIVYYYLNIKLA